MSLDQSKILLSLIKIALNSFERYHEMIEEKLEDEAKTISYMIEGMEVENERGFTYIPKYLKNSYNYLYEEMNEISVSSIRVCKLNCVIHPASPAPAGAGLAG